MDKINNVFYFDKVRFKENFDSYSTLANICYPMKANSCEILISTLHPMILKNKGYFSVSTISHFDTLTKLKVSPDSISLINVLMDQSNIKYLYDKGVRFFTFDKFVSIKSFLEYADENCKISLRLSINEVFSTHHSHLGASLQEIRQMFYQINTKNKHIGLSFYIPPKLKNKKNALNKMFNFIEKNLSDLDFEFICISGLKEANKLNKQKLESFKRTLKLTKLYLEPGQYLLEQTFVLKSPIIRIDSKNLVIKNGIFSGLLDKLIYNKHFDFYFKHEADIIRFKHKWNLGLKKIYLYGGSGDSADILGKYYLNKEEIKLLKHEKYIYIDNVGAYFEEFYINHGGDFNIEYIIKE